MKQVDINPCSCRAVDIELSSWKINFKNIYIWSFWLCWEDVVVDASYSQTVFFRCCLGVESLLKFCW